MVITAEKNQASVDAMQRICAKAVEDSAKIERRAETRQIDTRLEIGLIKDSIEDHIRAMKIFSGPLTDARKSMDDGVRELKRVTDETTQEFVLRRKEAVEQLGSPETPRTVRWLFVTVGDLGWKHRLRIGAVVVTCLSPWLLRWPEIYAGIKLLLQGGP